MTNLGFVQSTTLSQITAQEILIRQMPSLKQQIEYWSVRLENEFAMSLTADVEAGKVTDKSYRQTQEKFCRKVMLWVAEEIDKIVSFNHSQRNGLRFEDFGIGQGWLLPIMKMASDAGFKSRVWDFTEKGHELGRPILEDLFTSNRGTIPPYFEELMQYGALQMLFGDDPTHHRAKGFNLALFSRILQDNPQDLDKILPNIPIQAQPEGRVVVVTIFEENNRHVKYRNSVPSKKTDFLPTFNARLPKLGHWQIIREEDFAVDSEIYTIATVAEPNMSMI